MSSPNQLSFLPDDYLDTKRQRRTNLVFAVLFIAIISSIGGSFYVTERSMRVVEKEYLDTDKQYAEAAKRIEQVRQMQEKQRKMAHQAELTASLLEKVPRSFLLAEITNSMPAGVSLLDMMLDSKVRQSNSSAGKTQFEMKRAAQEAAADGKPAAPPVAQAKLYDVTMKITGVADNDVQVSQFISKLGTSKLLKEVNLLISDEFVFNENKMRKFQIEMTVDPAAEVQPGLVNPKGAAAAVELKQ